MQKKLAATSFFLIAIILCLHLLANTFYWYVSIPWFDMLMHTLGGVFLAFFAATLAPKFLLKNFSLGNMLAILVVVFIVGLGWEAFEYIVQYVIKGSIRLAHIGDSISDMVCDMVGGVIGVYLVKRIQKRYNARHGIINNAS